MLPLIPLSLSLSRCIYLDGSFWRLRPRVFAPRSIHSCAKERSAAICRANERGTITFLVWPLSGHHHLRSLARLSSFWHKREAEAQKQRGTSELASHESSAGLSLSLSLSLSPLPSFLPSFLYHVFRLLMTPQGVKTNDRCFGETAGEK